MINLIHNNKNKKKIQDATVEENTINTKIACTCAEYSNRKEKLHRRMWMFIFLLQLLDFLFRLALLWQNVFGCAYLMDYYHFRRVGGIVIFGGSQWLSIKVWFLQIEIILAKPAGWYIFAYVYIVKLLTKSSM